METPKSKIQMGNLTVKATPIWLTATFWKRFAVVFSVALSFVSLVLSAVTSLKTESKDILRALTISSIVVNAVSVSLSALTSLDWQKESTHDAQFAHRLMRLTHVLEGEAQTLVVTGRVGGKGGGGVNGRGKDEDD